MSPVELANALALVGAVILIAALLSGLVERSGVPQVAIFLAQGYAGRTTISCDDGRTWIENRSMDDSLRCFQGIDCDHHPGRAKGIVYTRGGTFVATYGWGPAGGVERSRDGVNWERTLEGTTFGGIATEGDHVLLGAHDVRVSEDDGETWEVNWVTDQARIEDPA